MSKSTVSDIEVTPGLQGQDRVARLGRGQDKESLANKLRGKGWSYRRIAESLEVQYGIVSRWLSGPAIPSPPEPMPRYVPGAQVRAAPSRPASATAEPPSFDEEGLAGIAARHAELVDRCDRLLATLETERSESRAREGRLLGLIERLEKLVEDAARRNGV
jgi:hypothetical protein